MKSDFSFLFSFLTVFKIHKLVADFIWGRKWNHNMTSSCYIQFLCVFFPSTLGWVLSILTFQLEDFIFVICIRKVAWFPVKSFRLDYSAIFFTVLSSQKIKTFKSKQNCQNPQKRLSSRLSLLTVIQDGIIEIGCAKMSTKFRSADIPNHMWKRPA